MVRASLMVSRFAVLSCSCEFGRAMRPHLATAHPLVGYIARVPRAQFARLIEMPSQTRYTDCSIANTGNLLMI